MIEVLLDGGGVIALFLISFASASLLPYPIEPAIIGALKFYSPEIVFIVVMCASVLANLLNYYIGKKGIHSWLVKRDIKDEKKAQKWFKKYGDVVLFLYPWVPIVGDLLTLVAGTLEMSLKRFVFWVIFSKSIKVIIVIIFGEKLLSMLGVW